VKHIVDLVLVELLKLRGSRMPWVLLLALVALCQVGIWTNYGAYNTLQRVGAPQDVLSEQYGYVVLPGSLDLVYRLAATFGLIGVAILTASVYGSEYSLGTLRPILIRGAGRVPYLVAKLVTLIVASGAALLMVGVLSAASSALAGALVGPPPTGTPPSADWSDALGAFFRCWLPMIPYMAFTGMIAVLTRSTTAALATSLGYYLLEAFAAPTLARSTEDALSHVADYLLLRNINSITGGGFVGVMGSTLSMSGSALRLALYTALMAAVTVVVFTRRDITGPSAG